MSLSYSTHPQAAQEAVGRLFGAIDEAVMVTRFLGNDDSGFAPVLAVGRGARVAAARPAR